jgi:REP element-mobilizing transposase RayT
MFHFVWIPTYRHVIFVAPYSEAMKAIIQKIGYEYDFDSYFQTDISNFIICQRPNND